VESVAKRLASSEIATRLAALEQLESLAPAEGAPAVMAIASALDDKDPAVKIAALAALSSLRNQAKPAVDKIIGLIDSTDSVTSHNALIVLGTIGPEASGAREAIVAALEGDDPGKAIHAAWALARISPRGDDALAKALPKIAQALVQNPELRTDAIRTLVTVGQPGVKLVRRLLFNEDARVQFAATQIAIGLGPVAGEATEDLIRVLGSDAPPMLLASTAQALGSIGPAASAAADPLAKLLGSEDVSVRANAADALGKIGVSSPDAVERLINATKDENAAVRREAMTALGTAAVDDDWKARITATLIDGLDDANPGVQVASLEGLNRLGLPKAELLARELSDPRAAAMAAVLLGEMGPNAAPAVPALEKALNSDLPPEVKLQVIVAIGSVGAEAAVAAPALIEALSDQNPIVRYSAAYALGSIGPEAAASVEGLEKLAASDNAFEQLVATWALARVQPDNRRRVATALDLLAQTLVGEDDRLRVAAARGLVELNVQPSVKLVALQEAFSKADSLAVRRAMQVLGDLIQPAIPLLIEQLNNADTAAVAALALGQAGPEAAAAVPGLVKLLSGPDMGQKAALVALAEIGPKSASAVPALVTVLQSEEEDTQSRMLAAWALGRIGLAAADAATPLKTIVAGENSDLRVMAAWALVHIRPEGEDLSLYVPLLVEGASDQRPLVRRQMALGLGQVGATSPQALAALEALAADPIPEVSSAAVAALEAISKIAP
jgi:HEAT repeat protein